MTYFNQDRGNRGGGNFKPRFGGGDQGGRPQMFHGTCSQCGKDCMLPFEPNGRRPVYCSECFEASKSGDSQRSSSNSYQPRYNDNPPQRPQATDDYKNQFSALSNKLDKIIRLLTPVAPEVAVKQEMTNKIVENIKATQ